MIAVIWVGMAFFYSEMTPVSKGIFYLVTSWLLLLLVLVTKDWLKARKR